MINWIAGNWPDGFSCLVNHDGVFDNRMMYYATEELWFPEWEHGGPYWANPEGTRSTIRPTHVELEHADAGGSWRARLSDSGDPGPGAFTALQRRGVPSEFLYFPDENHWVLRPSNSVLWHDTVLAWMDRWLENRDE